MTEQEIARFELVLKEAARIRKEIAAEEAEDARRSDGTVYLTVAPLEENFYSVTFAA